MINWRYACAVEGQSDFDPAAKVGERFYGDCGPQCTRPLFDRQRAAGAPVELGAFETARETEPAAVVVDQQDELSGVDPEPDDDVPGAAVAPDVHQRLLDDAAELASDARRQRQLVEAGRETRGDAAVAAEPVDRRRHEGDEVAVAEVERLHLLHQLAEGDGLLVQQLLHVLQPGGNRVEVTTGGYFVYDPDFEPVTWTAEERARGQYWGVQTIESFHTYGTPDVEGQE